MTMRMILIAATACATTACGGPGGPGGPDVMGDYGGDSCTYENMSLRADGVASVTWNGAEIALQYRQEGAKITMIKPNGSSSLFTLKGNDLVLEHSMFCTRK
ncbi:MAG: hypothetical protein EXR87_01020 [Gammaproteobacteria bacterium]|nr:hypothetical protein [Gammaproteobacteria bacterium]